MGVQMFETCINLRRKRIPREGRGEQGETWWSHKIW